MTSGASSAGNESTGCPLCAIVAGAPLASVVFSDDHFVAFMAVKPVSNGHVIIATREHAHYLDEMGAAVGSALYTWIHRIRHALQSVAPEDDDVRFFVSEGEPDYSAIAHVHAHVFPNRRITAPRGNHATGDPASAGRSQRDAMAQKLSQVLVDRASEGVPVGPPLPGHSAVFFSRHHPPRYPT